LFVLSLFLFVRLDFLEKDMLRVFVFRQSHI
jgi:hypothetical protein